MMKYVLLIFLLVLPAVYAQDLILAKEVYSPKETFQAEVFIKDIKSSDISILNPIGYGSGIGINLLEISRKHYFVFFDIPEIDPGNYTLEIKESKKQFQIIPDKKIISISPGAVKFTPEDSPFFKITVSNHGIKSETVEITSSSPNLVPSLPTLIIPGKSSKTFNIKLDKPESNLLASLSIGDYYQIPVWFMVKEEIIPFFEKGIEEITEEGLIFYIESGTQLNYITKEIQESTPIVDSIYFKNLLNESLTDLQISLTGNLQDIVKLEFTELKTLVPNEEKKLDIVVNEERLLLEDKYSGDLLITAGEYNFKLPINFVVVEVAEEPESLTLEESTEELEEVESEINETKTEEKPKGIQYKWAYLVVLIVILMIFAYLSLRKPKAKKQTFKEYIKKAGY